MRIPNKKVREAELVFLYLNHHAKQGHSLRRCQLDPDYCLEILAGHSDGKFQVNRRMRELLEKHIADNPSIQLSADFLKEGDDLEATAVYYSCPGTKGYIMGFEEFYRRGMPRTIKVAERHEIEE